MKARNLAPFCCQASLTQAATVFQCKWLEERNADGEKEAGERRVPAVHETDGEQDTRTLSKITWQNEIKRQRPSIITALQEYHFLGRITIWQDSTAAAAAADFPARLGLPASGMAPVPPAWHADPLAEYSCKIFGGFFFLSPRPGICRGFADLVYTSERSATSKI